MTTKKRSSRQLQADEDAVLAVASPGTDERSAQGVEPESEDAGEGEGDTPVSAAPLEGEVIDAEVFDPLDGELDGARVIAPSGTAAAEGGEGGDLALPLPVPKTSRDLVPLDALALYLRELSRYPALSREEEHELALRYYNQKDIQAAYKLIASNLWLVVKIAREYERATRNLLDLVQEGNIGLMEAVKNYDPYRGVRLPSYAVWWIKAYIVRYLIANWRLVKIGTTQAQRKLFFNLKKEKEKLERAGFAPTPKLIAERLDVRESDVVEMEQRLSGSDVSVDAPLQGEGETNLLSLLPAPTASAEDLLARKQMRALVERTLREFASTLNPKELIIFTDRMLAEEKATLQEISERVKVSRERVRQIENKVQDKLRKFVQERFGAQIDQLEF